MRGKLYSSNMAPDLPKGSGKVYDAASPEGISFLKQRVGSGTERTIQKEVREAKDAEITDEQQERIIDFVNTAMSPVAVYEVAELLQANPMKTKHIMTELAKMGEFKRLSSGKFCSERWYNGLDESLQWQYDQQF